MDASALRAPNLNGAEFVGTVVNNVSPNKDNRVTIRVPLIHDRYSDSQLPWVLVPQVVMVGGVGVGWFGQPEVGAKLYIQFQQGNPDFPICRGRVVGASDRVVDGDTDYPNTWGFVDSVGNKLVVNKTTKVTTFLHNSGSQTVWQADGSVVQTIVGSLTQTVAGDMSLTVTGNITSKATQWTHTGPLTVNGLGTFTQGMVVNNSSGGAAMTMNGNALWQTGTITVSSGDVVATGISLKGHTHNYDGGTTSTPN